MPRTYQTTCEVKSTTFSENDMRMAVYDIIVNGLQVRAAAAKYGLKKSTIQFRVSKFKAKNKSAALTEELVLEGNQE